jgi:hypothetical protein
MYRNPISFLYVIFVLAYLVFFFAADLLNIYILRRATLVTSVEFSFHWVRLCFCLS